MGKWGGGSETWKKYVYAGVVEYDRFRGRVEQLALSAQSVKLSENARTIEWIWAA